MPFDYEEYEKKCSTLSPEALQKEWENYTRQIAGGATSTAGSVLFAPFTAGASLVGLGLSTPRIHNARKKRAIIEEHLQAHGTTHQTRKRDVVAPMAVAGTLGGLTLGFAGAGADMIAGEAVGKGVEYVVSHAALEVAGATLEHKHDESKKMKDQLELAKKYGSVEGPAFDQKTMLLSPPAATQSSLRKSKSETHLDGLAYGSLLDQKRPVKPPRPPLQPTQPYQVISQPEATQSTTEGRPISQPPPTNPASAIQLSREEDKNLEKSSGSGMKLPYIGLLDHDEAEKRGLKWDPARGVYVQPESVNTQQAETFSSPHPDSYADLEPVDHKSDELDDLLSQLLVENSESLLLQTANPVLVVPDEKSPSLPPRPQSLALPPRPKSSIGSYSTPTFQSVRPERLSYIPPPPPPQQPNLQAAIRPIQLQYTPQQHYNPNQYSPSPSPLPAQLSYQPAHVQFPQYQYYPPPPLPPNHIPPPPARRPSPKPLQRQYSPADTQQRHDSTSSISTVSSASSFNSVATASTVSAASTPLTSYSTTPSMLTPMSSHPYDPALYEASPKPAGAQLCPSPKPVAAAMYFPPPPTDAVAGEKGKSRGYFG
jgi:hypothetical protein